LMSLSNLLPGLFESEAVRRQLDWFISGHGEDDGILRRARGYLVCGNQCLALPSPTAVIGGAAAAVESSRYALGASDHPPRDARAERRLAFAGGSQVDDFSGL
jgi:hypothetical protein